MTGVYHLIYWMVDQPCQLSLVHQQPLLVSRFGFCGKEEERRDNSINNAVRPGLFTQSYCRAERERLPGLLQVSITKNIIKHKSCKIITIRG